MLGLKLKVNDIALLTSYLRTKVNSVNIAALDQQSYSETSLVAEW